MTFEFTVQPSFNFLTNFAETFNTSVYKNTVTIPADMGDGFIKKIDVDTDFKSVLHHYTLKQDFHLKRLAPKEKHDLISIVFNSNEIPTSTSEDREAAIQFIKNKGCAIQIASGSLGTETFFPAKSEVHFAVIGIRPKVLASLLRVEKPNALLNTILNGTDTFFYHENMFPEVQRILKQLSDVSDVSPLGDFYYRIKIQELLYLLFEKLLCREVQPHSAINKADLDKLYAIKATIIADVSMPPRLDELSKMAGMSETKMKKLFKQVFGDSIYNYYQKMRMEEAAFLLKQAGYSVSEVGYRLGFANLSHFSRLFEKHYGVTPKRYALAG